MPWVKQGLIFTVDEHPARWALSHACVPTALVSGDKIRIYFAPRNEKGQSIPTFFEVAADDPTRLTYVHPEPVMSLGELGTFDDGGIMPCCIIPHDGLLYLYYVGWNPSVSVDYRNAVGLAISRDGGLSFRRPFMGAIVDRSMEEPFFTASPWVMKASDRWHMWYASGTGFLRIDDRVEPLYLIHYAASDDGIRWNRSGRVCIHPLHPEEANARATVIRDEDGTYHMWFCYRGSRDFRDGKDAYRIGYARSEDAVSWIREDEKAGIAYSDEGWDSKMQAYPCVIEYEGRRYLFYNGNGFGATGIGYAVWENE